MLIASIGGMELLSWSKLPQFLYLALTSYRHAKKTQGCVHVGLFRKGRIFFVLSVWEDRESMHEFAHFEAHKDLMKRASETTKSARNYCFETEDTPSNEQAHAKWLGSAS
ncbi:MAG: heme-degrading monooxygenase HmoA [Paracoccaceae bacterium]|jgi:heme-degrading monooxygenase HmoA